MSIQITPVGAAEAVVLGPEAIAEWRTKHTLEVPGHEYTPRFRRGQWDGKWTPGKWLRQRDEQFEIRVSRGILPRLLRDLGYQLSSTGGATAEQVQEFCTNTPAVAQLRDYQLRALQEVLLHGWGRVAYATNAGKGAVIALLALFASRYGMPVLILCDEIAVYDALYTEIVTWAGVHPGEVRRGCKHPPKELITLAMVPSLYRRLSDEDGHEAWVEWLSRMQMVLCDEADKADAATWRAILKAVKNSRWRVGFSGTFPEEGAPNYELYQDLRYEEILGPVIVREKNAAMVARGVSAKPNIEVWAFEGTPALTGFPRDWWHLSAPEKRNWVYDRTVLNNQARHEFILRRIRPDAPTAVIVNRIEHGHVLSLSIPGSVFLDGSASNEERNSALDAFARGDIKVVVVTKILDRGTNRLGHATDIIFASGEGSTTQTLQRIGRGLRRGGGKAELRLVDIMDRVTVPRDADGKKDKRMQIAAAFLHNAVRKRLHVYANEEFEVEIKHET